MRVLEEERAQHREAARRRVLRLRVDVRHQRVAELERAAEVFGQSLVILPRLARRRAVCARVRGEHAQREPAAVEVARRAVDEAAHVVAPVGEAREAEREPAAQLGRHRRVGVLRVAAPVQRVALAPGPRAARPDDVLARRLARDVGDGLVVAQRIEVVLVPAPCGPRRRRPSSGAPSPKSTLMAPTPSLRSAASFDLIPASRPRGCSCRAPRPRRAGRPPSSLTA